MNYRMEAVWLLIDPTVEILNNRLAEAARGWGFSKNVFLTPFSQLSLN